MAKNIVKSILVLVLTGIAAGGAETANKVNLLTDGFILSGVDGKLIRQDSNEAPSGQHISKATVRWFFEFDSDVSGGTGRIYAGANIELLPSATLEKMAVEIAEHAETSCRLTR